jgi:hypothetical protein
MKTLLFALVTSTLLYSCGPETKTVRLSNGALVNVINNTGINYTMGSSVCVMKSTTSGWHICNDGEMIDTAYTKPMRTKDGALVNNIITHKIGKISTY